MVKYTGKRVRENKNLSVRGLAKAAGISSGTVSKWENGISVPDLAVLDLVAKVMEVNPFDLVEFT